MSWMCVQPVTLLTNKDMSRKRVHTSGRTCATLSRTRRLPATVPIAIICHTDKCSTKAVKLLAQKGFNDVHDVHIVKGGMMEWNRLGFVIEQ